VKIALDELEQAIEWIKKNTDAVSIRVSIIPARQDVLNLAVTERNGQEAHIELYSADTGDEKGLRTPKLKRTTSL
jgi:hypothetical protein